MKTYYLGSQATRVDPRIYGGWDGFLAGVAPDIRDTSAFFVRRGSERFLLENADMTDQGFVNVHKVISANAKAGDVVAWYHSGHGVPKVEDGGLGEVISNDNDRYDEGICLYNGIVSDNFIRSLLAMYAKGVNLVCIFDTCYSGELHRVVARPDRIPKAAPSGIPRIPSPPKEPMAVRKVAANLISIGACQTYEVAYDMGTNGLWTRTFLDAFKEGMTWAEWFKAAKKEMPADQTPRIRLEKSTAFSKTKV